MFLLLAVARATVLGIDLGESKIVASILSRNHAIKIATNMASKRETPAYFAVWNRDRKALGHPGELDGISWACGSTAYDTCLRNPDVCVKGNHFDNNTYGLLRGYEITALVLADLVDSIRQGENITDRVKVVLAVPPEMGPDEKTMLYTACALAGVHVKGFVDSFEAIATMYALEREVTFTRWGKTVLFLDIGASAARASVFDFRVVNGWPSFVQLSYNVNASLGGDSVDELLMDAIARENYIDLGDAKVRMNMLDKVRHLKEKWNIKGSDSLKIDGIQKVTVKQELFDEAMKGYVEALGELINKTVEESKVNVISGEVVGSATRMSFIDSLVGQFLEREDKPQKSLNAETAVAMGAGYCAARFSGTHSVRHVNKSSMVKHTFTENVQGTTLKLFHPGDSLKTLATLDVAAQPGDELLVSCNGKEALRFTIDIQQQTQLSVAFVHSNFQLPIIANITDKAGTQYKFKRIPLAGDLTVDEYLEANATVRQLIELTKTVRQFQQVRSVFEAYMIQLEHLLEEEGLASQEKELITNVVATMKGNLEDADHEGKAAALEQKLQEIKNDLDPVITRLTDMVERPLLLEALRSMLHRAQAHMEECKYATDESIDDFDHFVDEMVQWLEKVDGSTETSDIRERRNQLQRKMDQLKAESMQIEEQRRRLDDKGLAAEEEEEEMDID